MELYVILLTVLFFVLDVFRYLYWSDTTSIYRVPLNDVRISSSPHSCASDISSKIPLINNAQLETFTLEPNEAFYYIGYDPCFVGALLGQTNRSILGATLNARERRVYAGSTDPVVTMDSFDRTLFFATESSIVGVDTSQVATCPVFPSVPFFAERSALLLRTFRSVKQPLPSKCRFLSLK